MTESIEKSFLTDPLTTNNAVYFDSLTLRKTDTNTCIEINIQIAQNNDAVSAVSCFPTKCADLMTTVRKNKRFREQKKNVKEN